MTAAVRATPNRILRFLLGSTAAPPRSLTKVTKTVYKFTSGCQIRRGFGGGEHARRDWESPQVPTGGSRADGPRGAAVQRQRRLEDRPQARARERSRS